MIPAKSVFEENLNGKHVLAKFLDKNLYEKLEIRQFTRSIPNKNYYLPNHHRGSDVTFYSKESNYMIDEIPTLYYPNGIPTIAFELSYKKGNSWQPGWFYDEKKEAEYYLLAWPKRPLFDLREKDIQCLDVMLLRRKDIHDYLNRKFGINKESIQTEIDKIIKANQYGKLHTIRESSFHYYYYTEYLAETPINLVIQKHTLKKLAIFHYVVYRNKPYAKNKDSIIWLKKEYQL